MDYIQVDRGAFPKIKRLLFGKKKMLCLSCGIRVTKSNYGAINRNGAYCQSLFCLMKMLEKDEAKN